MTVFITLVWLTFVIQPLTTALESTLSRRFPVACLLSTLCKTFKKIHLNPTKTSNLTSFIYQTYEWLSLYSVFYKYLYLYKSQFNSSELQQIQNKKDMLIQQRKSSNQGCHNYRKYMYFANKIKMRKLYKDCLQIWRYIAYMRIWCNSIITLIFFYHLHFFLDKIHNYPKNAWKL